MHHKTNIRASFYVFNLKDRLPEGETPATFDQVVIHLFDDGTILFKIQRGGAIREDRFGNFEVFKDWWWSGEVPAMTPGELLCFYECLDQMIALEGFSSSAREIFKLGD